jgi:hypothetical protein
MFFSVNALAAGFPIGQFSCAADKSYCTNINFEAECDDDQEDKVKILLSIKAVQIDSDILPLIQYEASKSGARYFDKKKMGFGVLYSQEDAADPVKHIMLEPDFLITFSNQDDESIYIEDGKGNTKLECKKN